MISTSASAPKVTKRAAQAQETRRAIFEHAVNLFREKGFYQVTIEEITNRAGTAKGSFYTYFKTKSDIIIEEFKTIDDYYRAIRPRLRRIKSAEERLVTFTRLQMRHVRDAVGLAMLKILYATTIMDPSAEKYLISPERYLHSVIVEIMEYGQGRGEIRSDLPPEDLARLFNQSMRSIFLDWAISDDTWDLVQGGVKYCQTILVPALVRGKSLP